MTGEVIYNIPRIKKILRWGIILLFISQIAQAENVIIPQVSNLMDSWSEKGKFSLYQKCFYRNENLLQLKFFLSTGKTNL